MVGKRIMPPCPYCGVGEGEPCIVPKSGAKAYLPHAARVHVMQGTEPTPESLWQRGVKKPDTSNPAAPLIVPDPVEALFVLDLSPVERDLINQTKGPGWHVRNRKAMPLDLRRVTRGTRRCLPWLPASEEHLRELLWSLVDNIYSIETETGEHDLVVCVTYTKSNGNLTQRQFRAPTIRCAYIKAIINMR